MPRRYSSEVRCQVIELARSGTRVAQLASTFGVSEAAIYLWLKQGEGRSPAWTHAAWTWSSSSTGRRRSTLEELTDWTLWGENTLVV